MTIAIKIKELMANMPDTLNTKKEIDDYYKDAMKKSVENNKLDANAVKPKKELNGYQKFMKENIKNVKEQNPSLTGPEVFSKIAELWKKQKETGASVMNNVDTVVSDVLDEPIVNDDKPKDVDKAVDADESEVKPDVKSDVKADVKVDKKKKGK
jgi:hypothetical protein